MPNLRMFHSFISTKYTHHEFFLILCSNFKDLIRLSIKLFKSTLSSHYWHHIQCPHLHIILKCKKIILHDYNLTLVCFHPCATPPFKGYIRVTTHKMGHGSCLLQQIFTNIKNMDMFSFICGQYAH